MDLLRFSSLTQLHQLSHEQLAQVAPHASERTIPAGRRILLDGPFAQELALIASGRGVVRCAGETVTELGPGHVFGEFAPERPVYETATVTAVTELRLVVFGARALRILRSVAPETVAALVEAFSAEQVAGAAVEAEPRPAPHLTIVRSAAA
jgi:CRP-like cAMP-binding protein